MGVGGAKSFIGSFNTTSGFPSAFIDVGSRDGAGIEAICSELSYSQQLPPSTS